MKDGDIDYSRYTRQEMEEAFAGIRKDAYPLNYANLRSAYAALTSEVPPPSLQGGHEPSERDADEFEDERPPQRRYDESGRYVPNHIPLGERKSYLVFSTLLFAYGTYGVWVNDLYLPGRGGLHLYDLSAWSMYGAILCACLVMLLVIVDHYDRRDNELNYWFIGRVLKGLGWFCFTVSLAWAMVQQA